MNKNFLEVNQEIDKFVNKQIEFFEKKRNSIKDKFENSFFAQKNSIDAQRASFVACLDCTRSSVNYVEQTLKEGTEIESLFAKNQLIQQLREFNSSAVDLEPRGKVSYYLETDPQMNTKALEGTVIREYDEEYRLSIGQTNPNERSKGSNIPYSTESYCSVGPEQQDIIKSKGVRRSKFYIRPKRVKVQFSHPTHRETVL